MIRFINNNGEAFDGVSPYIHWIDGQLSIGIWYTLKLMIVSNHKTLRADGLEGESIFRLIDQECYGEDSSFNLNDYTKTNIESVGQSITIGGTSYYLHQILLVCESDKPGTFTDTFVIHDGDEDKVINIGVDLYDENEILSINLGNRGMDIPLSIQKTFLENNLNEANIDFALINRKFKELISNYIDIVDNKGSYLSLYNSLKWFEWGENTKLYEIWQNDNNLLEKELSLILKDEFSNLLVTHKKTTHLSLVAALQKISDNDIVIDPDTPGFNDRNPAIENVSYQWSKDDIMLKISLLGAFFERYFMPIHLDLKRATAESLIFTNQIKTPNGTIYRQHHYHDDTGVIEINMDHNVVLGNINFVAVGKETMFSRKVDPTMYSSTVRHIEPIGVDKIKKIGSISNESSYSDASDNVATFYVQLKGGVGTIVPVNVKVDMPEGDGLVAEVMTLYKEGESPVQIIERKLCMSDGGVVTFDFNLLSTKEETVRFDLTLYSLSGHVWTTTQEYNCIDVRGSYLDIYSVKNTFGKYNDVSDWIKNTDYVPYSLQNQTEQNPTINQFIPYQDKDYSQFNQLVLVENVNDSTSWVNDNIESNYWIIERSGLDGVNWNSDEFDESILLSDNGDPKYLILIRKTPGKYPAAQIDVKQAGGDDVKILRSDIVFIPQVHEYTNIEDEEKILEKYTFTSSDLLCVVPQFKSTIPINRSTIRWEYINKTTFEKISTTVPIQVPLIASKNKKLLSPGYWTVNMYYKLENSKEMHKLTKNSAFRIKKDL